MFQERKFTKMDGKSKRFVRFHNNAVANMDSPDKFAFEIENNQYQGYGTKQNPERQSATLSKLDKSFEFGTAKVHSEGDESNQSSVWDPRDRFLHRWNRVFVFVCLATLFIDPLFYYLPKVNENLCLEVDNKLRIVVTILRSITDLFHLFHIMIQFRTGYIVPSSRILGRGELVTNLDLIAKCYLKGNFIIDFIAIVPLPQVMIWAVIPALNGSAARRAKIALWFIILFQLAPRLYPLFQQIGKSSGRVAETAWSGAAYNLLLYILISHFFGASWYLLTVERQDTCWAYNSADQTVFRKGYLDCSTINDPQRNLWNRTVPQETCNPNNVGGFNFGIYANAITHNITSMDTFTIKYLFCFWWGLQNLSTLGQGLNTSSFVGEVIFSIIIAISGLTLFARLIGNMQTYLQSLTVRLEEMRLKRRDMDQWMQHRQLPQQLRERVHSYEQYKWLETRGVKEKELVETLPKDLRRDIKRHLCLKLVKGVPLFASMDERLLDAICERLQPTLFTKETCVVNEGEPVNEMLLIIRGHLKSQTTDGGRTGFLNVAELKPGDFCGEELLPWALDPKSDKNLPLSTRSVQAETEVEAFALASDDLKFVASQFRRLHSKQVQHTLRNHSQQWRTWAASSIQVAWRRYKRRKLLEMKQVEEQAEGEELLETYVHEENNNPMANVSYGGAFFAARFAANTMRAIHRLRGLQAVEENLSHVKLMKPPEPDFSAEEGD